MSKAALNKTLKQLDADELRELLLQVYDARKEAKDYLEFFLNPDIEKKRLEAIKTINKEMGRHSKRRFACRVSNIKKALKLFATYQPEDEMFVKLYLEVIRAMCGAAQIEYFQQSFQNGAVALTTDFLKFIDKNGLFGEFFPALTTIIEGIEENHYDTRNFKNALKDAIDTFAVNRQLRP